MGNKVNILRCVKLALPKNMLVLQIVLISSVLLIGLMATAQEASLGTQSEIDSDHDGLSDGLEQALLVQFKPTFLVAQHDCSNLPSEFSVGIGKPQPELENGTIYGQVFPTKSSSADAPAAEIHYYHLWKLDCGSHGHPLDTEHVSVLVHASGGNPTDATWKAVYWYAAAHENTVCDVSQIARASTLDAEKHGPKIWISPGKHASYFKEEWCQRGCGADRCEKMTILDSAKVINLGEVGYPMNGSLFISSPAWPLAAKMMSSNFPPVVLARLDQTSDNEIAMFNAGRHPAQGVIAISSHTEQTVADHSQYAMNKAADSTDAAVATAQDSTGNALQKSYRHTKHALGISMRHIGEALHVTQKLKLKQEPQSGEAKTKNKPATRPPSVTVTLLSLRGYRGVASAGPTVRAPRE